MDISKLSIADLKELQSTIPSELSRRQKQAKAETLKELRLLAESRGFNLNELVSESIAATKNRPPVAVKYRHPQDNALNWTGRGRQPTWVVAFLKDGGKMEELAV
ncbi:H-NS histone family protein [Azonexus hydrophilus]|uniref:H-NS histone family protein n=1 Tax=Azonexus hydrophilus TaxID=418702 RepID=A0ABZ2XLF5_9RHOO